MPLSPYPTVGVVVAATEAALYALPDVFPKFPGRDWVVGKTPNWATGIRRAASGREVRSSDWSAPIYDFKIRHPVLRDLAAKPELQSLIAFFNSRRGRFGFFFYYDPDDFQVTAQVIATGDGTTKSFQLIRTVGEGTPYATTEPVYALWGAPVVKLNTTTTAAYTVNPWGVITFTNAPANGVSISYTGKALFVCRFDQDRLSFEQIMKALWSQDGLTFCSLKP